jgi:hypothetical protein
MSTPHVREELEMQPPIFSTAEDRFVEDRKNRAVRAFISVKGKLFCFHDYTCFGAAIRKHLHDWGYEHICTKCGKRKVFKYMQMEPFYQP